MKPQPDQIETLPITALKPFERNARTHSPDQVSKIAASLIEFGWTQPILVDEHNEIIAGHGRLLAAKQLKFAEVPVIRLEHLTPEQVRAYRIADNRLAELSGWDGALLAVELAELGDLDFDLDLTGFDGPDLDKLLASLEPEEQAEEVIPPPPVDPVTRPGDLWLLGDHRLLCGDATSADDVERLLDGARPHLMVTDPPYGVDYDPSWRHDAGRNNSPRLGTVSNDDRADWRDAWSLFPGDVAYVWHSGLHGDTVSESMKVCGFALRSQVIWAKSHLALSRGHYHWQHEPCFYAVRVGCDAHWNGARDQATLWSIKTKGDGDDATVHGTQKPIECMLRPILNNSTRGDAVYEPFSGSGTTIMAAEKSGRRCFGLEIDPRYCDVAVKRWQAATGKRAVLDGDGRTFDEAAAERVAGGGHRAGGGSR